MCTINEAVQVFWVSRPRTADSGFMVYAILDMWSCGVFHDETWFFEVELWAIRQFSRARCYVSFGSLNMEITILVWGKPCMTQILWWPFMYFLFLIQYTYPVSFGPPRKRELFRCSGRMPFSPHLKQSVSSVGTVETAKARTVCTRSAAFAWRVQQSLCHMHRFTLTTLLHPHKRKYTWLLCTT